MTNKLTIEDYKHLYESYKGRVKTYSNMYREERARVKRLQATILGYSLTQRDDIKSNEMGLVVQEVLRLANDTRYSPKVGPFLNANEHDLDLLFKLNNAVFKLCEFPDIDIHFE